MLDENNFEWRAEVHGTGVEAVDRDHRELMRMMADLKTSFELDSKAPTLLAQVKALQAAASEHFASELQLMAEADYPELKRHSFVHDGLEQRLRRFVDEFAASGSLPKEFFWFLKSWVTSDILATDKRFGRYLGNRPRD